MTAKSLNFQAPLSLAIAEGATSPDPGLAGVQVWSSTLGKFVYWDGAQWTAGSAASGGVVVSETEPASPYEGMEWFDETTGIQYTRVGTSWASTSGVSDTPTPVTATKPLPVDADQLIMLDSAAAGAPVLVTKAQLLAAVTTDIETILASI